MKTKVVLFLAFCLPAFGQFNFFNALSTWKGATNPSFNPTNYGTPIVWYSARKESFSNNDPIGTATDWTGNGFNATQSSAGAKPTFKTGILNGQPVFRFDGNSDYLSTSFTGTVPMTTFVVWKSSNPTKFYQRIIESSNDKGNIDASGGVSTAGATLYSGTVLNAAFDTSSFMVMTCIHNSTSSAIYVNGGLVVSGPDGSGAGSSSWVIGALYTLTSDQYLEGDLAEYVNYNSLLSSVNQQAVEDALGTIYSISITH